MPGKQHAREYAYASSLSINILEYCKFATNILRSLTMVACVTIYTRGKNVVRTFVLRNRNSSKDAFVRRFPNSQSLVNLEKFLIISHSIAKKPWDHLVLARIMADQPIREDPNQPEHNRILMRN